MEFCASARTRLIAAILASFPWKALHATRLSGKRAAQALALVLLGMAADPAQAGGPKFIAGSSYFNASVLGLPVHWSGGVVNYFVDPGALSSTVTHTQAAAMVDSAAALWSSVNTAAVVLTNKGALAEDVSGSNIAVSSKTFTAPADLIPAATSRPLAIVFDADGSVIDALFGALSSEPDNCSQNGVYALIDNINSNATIAHAILVLNGRCTSSADLITMMQFNLVRAFGRVLGLDYAQIYPNALTDNVTGESQAWPIMQPLDGVCATSGGSCIPLDGQLHSDDVAALNRIYPVTSANLSSLSGKVLTAANTISIKGTIHFQSGYGMQGVNVVARPLDSQGSPLYAYTVSAVTGAQFRATHGTPISGLTDKNGVAYSKWGSTDSSLQGSFDLSGIPLPPNVTTANYQVYFEAIQPDYINSASVGPYVLGQAEPSGTLRLQTLSNLTAGSEQTINLTVADSALAGSADAIGSEQEPHVLAASGYWVGRFSQAEQTDWMSFAVRAGRIFTVVAQALNAEGQPVNTKAMPSVGVWGLTEAAGSLPAASSPALNGGQAGECWLRVNTVTDDMVRMAVADERGDGRPDYKYRGWVLYADSVEPSHLPTSGGAFVLHGMGFRSGDTVLVGGQAAVITSISPNEITAIAPAASAGSADVEIDDESSLYAAALIPGGINYNTGSEDALTLITAPENSVPTMTPLAFTVQALDANLVPVANATVTYALTSGSANLGCGLTHCVATTSGDGYATISVTATTTTLAVVEASLSNGSTIGAHFTGGSASVITALTGLQSVAAGVTLNWTVQAQVIQNGALAAGQTVTWQTTVSGLTPAGNASATTNSNGIATKTLTLGPLSGGQLVAIKACVNGTSNCTSFTAIGGRTEYATLSAVSGTTQSISASSSPAAMAFRVYDMAGNPMAGATISLYQALYKWTQPCSGHTLCTTGALLGTASGAATSDLNGLVSFAPATLTGSATMLHAIAVTGNAASVNATVEQY